MSETFDSLWRFIANRSQGFPTVQEYHELEHIFNLMQGCESYLEIGTAEGNSLYVLAHALPKNGVIFSIDYGESHTENAREEILSYLKKRGDLSDDRAIYSTACNSHGPIALNEIINQHLVFDCVLIDAGHDYEDVIADAAMYGSLARKYIFFHDVCLPETNRAFEWYCKQRPECTAYKMINSNTFGYGIIKI